MIMMKRLFGGGRKKSKETSPLNGKHKNTEKDAIDKQHEKKYNDEIDKHMMDEAECDRKTISLLLLGPGGSGKSTVLKQMHRIYQGPTQDRILKDAAQYIRQNILEDIYDLATQNRLLSASHPECELAEECQEICTMIANLKGGHLEETSLNPELAKQIRVLWQDKGIQNTYQIRKRSHIMDNASYFFENIERIADEKYSTTFEDYVRVRHRTTGIIESTFRVDAGGADSKQKWMFKVTDVGGQRTERKKWLRCFTDIHAIIYVMSLAAYDQTLFEDQTQNCYREALDVFERTMCHEALESVDVIVFLNKNDLFVPKIKRVPFSVCVSDFDVKEVHNPNAVKDYLKGKFKDKFYHGMNPQKSPRRMHFHITCATDTNQIQTVMHLIQFETVRKMMRVGLMM